MSKIAPCIFGGNHACEKQGGTGSLSHATSYIHPYPHSAELGYPEPAAVQKSMKSYLVPEALGSFDEDLASLVLSLEVNKSINSDALSKSLYDFDLDSAEGVTKLLGLLVVLDEEIVKEVYQEVFVGYPKDTLDVIQARQELRGYFMDYLATNG